MTVLAWPYNNYLRGLADNILLLSIDGPGSKTASAKMRSEWQEQGDWDCLKRRRQQVEARCHLGAAEGI